MHDVQLEDRLRRGLREEGDSLPFTLTPDVLEARLARRRRQSRNARFGLLASAAAIVVASGAIFAVLNNRSDENVGPSPSSVASPSASVVPSSSPEASPSAADTPHPSIRPTGAIGAPNDAVTVRFVGDAAHPDSIVVELTTLDAGAFETNFAPRVLVQFAGSTIPVGFQLGQADSRLGLAGPRYGQDGWLAIGAFETGTTNASILIYDLRSPDAAPWVISGNVNAAAWGPGSILALTTGSDVRLFDADGQTTASIALPPEVRVADIENDPQYGDPTWLADGSGFLVQKGNDFTQYVFGTLALDGTFTASHVPAPILQVTGIERRWGADGSDLGGGCPTEGGPPGCVISVTKPGEGEVAVNWYEEDMDLGGIIDSKWDADGNGVWLLVNRTEGDGPKTFVLMHADEPKTFHDIATVTLDVPADTWPILVGLRDDATTADGQLFLFGSPQVGPKVGSILTGDGTHGSFAEPAVFVGWAGAQAAYPAN
ncbi:MAG TPA: hypothetical protein VGQ64_01375 [Candidatus Limnocylindrales bacterium]|jgi:hypothetical protein|nr:hypothetical protein [Candidatus Limnocylindrales bacterium]